jgi:DNA-binding response OmpR family regulator
MKSIQSDLQRNEPIHSLAAISAFPPLARISEPARTLLVVDDDPMLRDVETQLLRLQGYTVLEAENAAKALRLAREAAAIHLLITDFSMPKVDGLELTRRFRTVHPKTPVLMVSGSLPLIQHRADDLDRFETLEKPFEFKELLHKVRTLLDIVSPLPIRRQWCCD